MNTHLKIIDQKRRIVGEAPLWDDRKKVLYSVDYRGNIIHCQPFCAQSPYEIEMEKTMSTIALCENNDLIAVMENSINRIQSDGSREKILVPIPLKGRRFNDGKPGPDGCLYVGTKDENHNGVLYRCSPNGVFTEIISHLGSSNGIDWSEDGKQLYLCDSLDKTLFCFDFDLKNGTVSNRKEVLTLSADTGEFDGMCMDCEGNLWCAIWGAGKVCCIRPSDGTIREVIDLPVSKPSSCTFAGENLDILIITTASIRTDIKQEPLAGQTFAMKLGVSGRKAYRFGTV